MGLWDTLYTTRTFLIFDFEEADLMHLYLATLPEREKGEIILETFEGGSNGASLWNGHENVLIHIFEMKL